jgi:hypothetical protein
MATNYSDIYDLFLVQIQDYKIDNLSAYLSDLETYLKGFLIMAIPEFDNCEQDLEDRNDTTQVFTATLTSLEKRILADWMVYFWLQREVNNITQLSNFLQSADFKMYSSANNLKEKVAYSNSMREIISQRMTQYGLKNVDWTSWGEGSFS